jgi:hypothetical protein
LRVCGCAGARACRQPNYDWPGQTQPAHIDPKGCAPGERLQSCNLQLDKKTPQGTTGEALSDKLTRVDAVLCPPNVDPEIRAQAPGGGKTPMIPPPASPSGEPMCGRNSVA